MQPSQSGVRMEKLSGDAQIEHVQSNDTTTGKERDPAQTYEEEGVVKDAFGVKLDYSGATKKTDPVEIALVRKLDMWIMPMYDDSAPDHTLRD